MKTSRTQEAIEILKASIEDSSVSGRRRPEPPPKKSKKEIVKVKTVRKS
jgi:hypothetical protein